MSSPLIDDFLVLGAWPTQTPLESPPFALNDTKVFTPHSQWFRRRLPRTSP